MKTYLYYLSISNLIGLGAMALFRMIWIWSNDKSIGLYNEDGRMTHKTLCEMRQYSPLDCHFASDGNMYVGLMIGYFILSLMFAAVFTGHCYDACLQEDQRGDRTW